jgi:hypothetical protein
MINCWRRNWIASTEELNRCSLRAPGLLSRLLYDEQTAVLVLLASVKRKPQTGRRRVTLYENNQIQSNSLKYLRMTLRAIISCSFCSDLRLSSMQGFRECKRVCSLYTFYGTQETYSYSRTYAGPSLRVWSQLRTVQVRVATWLALHQLPLRDAILRLWTRRAHRLAKHDTIQKKWRNSRGGPPDLRTCRRPLSLELGSPIFCPLFTFSADLFFNKPSNCRSFSAFQSFSQQFRHVINTRHQS